MLNVEYFHDLVGDEFPLYILEKAEISGLHLEIYFGLIIGVMLSMCFWIALKGMV